MLATELIKKLEDLIKENGDTKVMSFDLDRDICDITEVEFSTYPEKSIWISA